MYIQIFLFIHIDFFVNIDNIIAVPVNDRTVSADFSIFEETVNHHIILNCRNIAGSDQGGHLHAIHFQIMEPYPVDNTVPAQPILRLCNIGSSDNLFFPFCKIRQEVRNAASVILRCRIGSMVIRIDSTVLCYQTYMREITGSTFQSHPFFQVRNCFTLITDKSFFNLIQILPINLYVGLDCSLVMLRHLTDRLYGILRNGLIHPSHIKPYHKTDNHQCSNNDHRIEYTLLLFQFHPPLSDV